MTVLTYATMPDWLRQLALAMGAFLFGRIWDGGASRLKEQGELKESFIRLTVAVEQIPQQINRLEAEIHRVGARSDAHLEALTKELASHKRSVENRLLAQDSRIDGLVEGRHQYHGPTVPWPRTHDHEGTYSGEGEHHY